MPLFLRKSIPLHAVHTGFLSQIHTNFVLPANPDTTPHLHFLLQLSELKKYSNDKGLRPNFEQTLHIQSD
jgi:hypothetical protein